MSQTAHHTDFGSTIRWWAFGWFPNCRAKRLGDMLGVSESQAKRIMSGESAPTNAHLRVLAKVWGRGFILHLFEGLSGPIAPAQDIAAAHRAEDAALSQMQVERIAENARMVAFPTLASAGLDTAPGRAGASLGGEAAQAAVPAGSEDEARR